jgi:hypothetical protein
LPAPPELEAALAGLAAELAACGEPWWLIGSAAMAVHGAAVEVRDIDLLMSETDAEALLAGRGLAAVPGTPGELFSSAIFASWVAPPFAIELFAGFCLRHGAGWQPLTPTTREAHRVGNTTIFVPSVAELIAWGRQFGRPKDKAREPLLKALLP